MIEVFDWGSKPPKRIAFCDSDDAIERLTKQGFDVWLKRKDLTVMVSFESEIEDYIAKNRRKEMTIPHIEIKTDGIVTRIFMDGHELHGVRGLRYEHNTKDEIPVLNLEINALDATLDLKVRKLTANGHNLSKIALDDGYVLDLKGE